MKWRKVRVGDFLIRVKDLVPITKAEEYSLVTIKLYHRGVQLRKKVRGSEIQADKMSRVKAGQFILSGIDARNGAFGIIPAELDGAVVTNDFWHFEIDKSVISNEYFLWLTSTPYFDDICNKASDGTTNRIRLQSDRFYSQELLLPEIQDQHRVVEELKSRSNKINSLTNEYQFQLTQIEKLKQAILQEAVQGKLVKQDKKDGSASELLNRIKAEKAKLGKKDKPLPPIKPEEIPFEIPISWVWCRLGEITDLITSGSRDWAKYYSSTGDIFVRMGNLSKNSFELRMDKIQYVNPPKNQEGNRTRLVENDILISITGEVGNLALIPKDFGEAYINQHTALVRLNNQVPTKFIAHLFISKTLQEQFNAPQRGMKNSFRLTDIEYLLIPLPPLSEQIRIVAEIEKQLTKTKQLTEFIIANQQATEQLLKALLHQAFEVSEAGVSENEEPELALAAQQEVPCKKGKVVPLYPAQEKEENHFVKRKVLATYIINQSLDDPQFGDVKFEKLLHLSDYFAIKRNLGQKFYKKVAGPLDNAFTTQYFTQIEQSKWFNRKKVGRQFFFSAGVNHNKSVKTYDYFSEEELKKVSKIITYFKKSDYEKPEIVSTLYAVWNNRLIKNEPISHEALIADFYDWDEAKKKYPEDRLQKALKWMKSENFIPDGWGNYIDKPKASKK